MTQDTPVPPLGEDSNPVGGDPTMAGADGQELPLAPLSEADAIELRRRAAVGVEVQERYLRLYADFENFKKRAARERDEVRRSAIEGMVERLLPVLDTFDMAMTAAQLPGASVETLKAGVQMIQGQLRGVFTDQGLSEIDTTGKDFDPALHEAVSQQETGAQPEGRILQQLRKGYRFKDRLLRPASVIVAKAPGSSLPGAAADDQSSAV